MQRAGARVAGTSCKVTGTRTRAVSSISDQRIGYGNPDVLQYRTIEQNRIEHGAASLAARLAGRTGLDPTDHPLGARACVSEPMARLLLVATPNSKDECRCDWLLGGV